MAAAEAAAALLERLEALSCPPFLGVPPLAPPAALALLCRPSEPRRALLRWLWARIDPSLGAHLESLPEDAQVRAMAELGAQLLLCGEQDLELLEGSAPPQQQLQFLQDLLDAAPPPETPPQNSAAPFLLQLLETPEGGAALNPPDPPPLDEELSETPPKSSAAPFLLQLLETPEGGAALNPPDPPPLDEELSETPPKSSAAPFLLQLLETPEGGAALNPPNPPPLDEELSETPPKSRRPLPELEAELGRVQRDLEQLQLKTPPNLGSPLPHPPDLGILGGSLSSLAAAFGVSELQGPPRPPRTPQIHPSGAQGPPVGRGLRELSQALGVLAQLGLCVGEVSALGERLESLGPQIPPLARRFQD